MEAAASPTIMVSFKNQFKYEKSLIPETFSARGENCVGCVLLLRAGLHKTRPAGRLRPAKAFLAARESFLKCRKC